MSLNNISLNNQMLVHLYSNSLLETGASPLPEINVVKFLGSNQKNILVIVAHKSFPFLPDNELNFLTTILEACKLSMDDIAIINKHAINELELQKIINFQAKNILLFGTGPLAIGLPINFPQFQLQQFNKRTYLHAPTLSELENDKALKLKLWNSLKLLFEI